MPHSLISRSPTAATSSLLCAMLALTTTPALTAQDETSDEKVEARLRVVEGRLEGLEARLGQVLDFLRGISESLANGSAPAEAASASAQEMNPASLGLQLLQTQARIRQLRTRIPTLAAQVRASRTSPLELKLARQEEKDLVSVWDFLRRTIYAERESEIASIRLTERKLDQVSTLVSEGRAPETEFLQLQAEYEQTRNRIRTLEEALDRSDEEDLTEPVIDESQKLGVVIHFDRSGDESTVVIDLGPGSPSRDEIATELLGTMDGEPLGATGMKIIETEFGMVMKLTMNGDATSKLSHGDQVVVLKPR